MAPLLVKTIGMKRRADRNPQRERWIQIIGFSILGGITLGLLIDRLQEPITYVKVAEAQEVEQEQVALIRVVYDKAGIERLIRETFPEEPNTAVAIAKCESGLNADIQSHHTLSYGREQSFGVFQIHARDHDKTAKRLGFEDYRTDVEDNIAMARFLYDSRGNFRDWTCYNSGGYKRHL